VRQVLDMLVNEGLIYRQRGRGTFVARPTIEESLVRLISFTEDMRQRGNIPGTRILRSETVPARAEIAGKLEMAEGEELALLERLRLADGEPMSIEQSHLVHRLCPGILEGDYVSASLRQALDEKCDVWLSRAQQVIRAVSATEEQARLLSVGRGAALLLIERVSYSQQDAPVEFLRIFYRGDRYSLYTELQG